MEEARTGQKRNICVRRKKNIKQGQKKASKLKLENRKAENDYQQKEKPLQERSRKKKEVDP